MSASHTDMTSDMSHAHPSGTSSDTQSSQQSGAQPECRPAPQTEQRCDLSSPLSSDAQTASANSSVIAPKLHLLRLAHGEGLDLPAYETAGAAGMDVRAAVSDPMTLAPGARGLVPTGFVFEIPQGFEVQVRPRSGLAFKHGVTCLNTPGTIDSDYRGEVKVLLINLGEADFVIERGMRIAQLVVAPVVQASVREADRTSQTTRGAGGFGSTGV